MSDPATIKEFSMMANGLKTILYINFFALSPLTASPPCMASGESPHHYLVLGDSMVRTGFGQALKSRFAKELNAKVKVFGKSASGLSRPDAFDWHRALDQAVDPAMQESSAYVMIGTNDCQDLNIKGKYISFGSPEWTEAYRERLKKFTESLCKNVRSVYWFGLPPMRPKKFNEKISQLNRITEDFFKSQPCVKYVATHSILGSSEGGFQSVIRFKNTTRTIRENDGIHLSYQGAQILVDYIIRQKFF